MHTKSALESSETCVRAAECVPWERASQPCEQGVRERKRGIHGPFGNVSFYSRGEERDGRLGGDKACNDTTRVEGGQAKERIATSRFLFTKNRAHGKGEKREKYSSLPADRPRLDI